MIKLYYTKKNKYTNSTSYPFEGLGVIVNTSSIILENDLLDGEGFDDLVIEFDELERGKLVFYDYMLSLRAKTHKIVKYLVEDVYDANDNLDGLIERMEAIGLEEDGFDISRKFLTIFIDSKNDIFSFTGRSIYIKDGSDVRLRQIKGQVPRVQHDTFDFGIHQSFFKIRFNIFPIELCSLIFTMYEHNIKNTMML